MEREAPILDFFEVEDWRKHLPLLTVSLKD
jgi:hypothetical protein